MTDEDFVKIHDRLNRFTEDTLLMKRDISEMKKCISEIHDEVKGINKKLFIGNGSRSFTSRLEALEGKVLVMWWGIGTLFVSTVALLGNLLVNYLGVK